MDVSLLSVQTNTYITTNIRRKKAAAEKSYVQTKQSKTRQSTFGVGGGWDWTQYNIKSNAVELQPKCYYKWNKIFPIWLDSNAVETLARRSLAYSRYAKVYLPFPCAKNSISSVYSFVGWTTTTTTATELRKQQITICILYLYVQIKYCETDKNYAKRNKTNGILWWNGKNMKKTSRREKNMMMMMTTMRMKKKRWRWRRIRVWR